MFSNLPAPPKQRRCKPRRRGKWGRAAGTVLSGTLAVLTLVLVWFNARGILNKEEPYKELLSDRGAVYGGVSESHTYKHTMALSDEKWKWVAGAEGKPSA